MAQVYQLVSKSGGVSYSPFVIWSELFLLHKKIEYTTVPLTFLDINSTINKLTDGKWDKVPVIKFSNGDIIFDSFEICSYLDEKYPENLIRRGSKVEDTIFEFFKSLGQCTFKLIILDLEANMDAINSTYLRKSKETLYGMTLEEFAANPESNITQFYKATQLLAPLLTAAPFFEGEEPGFCDYLVAGRIQPLRNINPKIYFRLIHENPNDGISEWARRIDELFGGYLKKMKNLQ